MQRKCRKPITTVVSDTIRTGQVTVGTTPTPIVRRDDRDSVKIENTSATVDIYIGNQNVDTASGYLVKANSSITLDRSSSDIYGITSSGTALVCFLEE